MNSWIMLAIVLASIVFKTYFLVLSPPSITSIIQFWEGLQLVILLKLCDTIGTRLL